MGSEQSQQLRDEIANTRKSRDRHSLLRLSELDAEEQAGPRGECQALIGKQVDALLAEYNSLRAESMNSTNNRVQVLMLGATAVAAISGGSFALAAAEKGKLAYLAEPVLCWSLPAICALVFLVWLGEARRAARAGYFLAAEIEPRLNALLGRFIMRWEGSLWAEFQSRDELLGPSMMAVGVFGVASALGPLFGFSVNHPGNFAPFIFHPLTSWRHLGEAGRSDVVLSIGAPYSVLAALSLYGARNLRHVRNRRVLQTVFRNDVASS